MCEFQNAFATSQLIEATREQTPDEVTNFDRIQSALDAGRFVVCSVVLRFCQFTDAVMGSSLWYAADFATRGEADAYVAADGYEEDYCGDGFSVLAPANAPPVAVAGCPF